MTSNSVISGIIVLKTACIAASSLLVKWEYISSPSTSVGRRIFAFYQNLAAPKSLKSMMLKVTILELGEIMTIAAIAVYAVAKEVFFGDLRLGNEIATSLMLLVPWIGVYYLGGYIAHLREGASGG